MLLLDTDVVDAGTYVAASASDVTVVVVCAAAVATFADKTAANFFA